MKKALVIVPSPHPDLFASWDVCNSSGMPALFFFFLCHKTEFIGNIVMMMMVLTWPEDGNCPTFISHESLLWSLYLIILVLFSRGTFGVFLFIPDYWFLWWPIGLPARIFILVFTWKYDNPEFLDFLMIVAAAKLLFGVYIGYIHLLVYVCMLVRYTLVIL